MPTALSRIDRLSPDKQELLAARLDPASFGQQRLWFLDQLQPGNPAYHVFMAVRLEGDLDVAALEQALGELVRRHQVLRTTLVMMGRRLVQLVHPAEPFGLERLDLGDVPGEQREAQIRRLLRLEFEEPFDLRSGPLLRVKLVRLGEGEHVVSMTLHHIVFDGWSRGIFLGELAALYQAAREGVRPDLPELTLQYTDFARWQRQWLSGEALERQLGFWRKCLEGAPSSLPLPFDRPRSKETGSRGARVQFQVPEPLASTLRRLCRRSDATVFMLLLAAFKVLLLRYCGTGDLSVGTPVAGRPRPELEGLIGFFVNTLVLRSDLSGNPRFSRVLESVRQVALDAYAHQELPFEKLVDELQPERELGVSPLFQAMFSLQSTAVDGAAFPGLRLTPLEFEPTAAQFDLMVNLNDTGSAIAGNFGYNRELFDPTTIRRLAAHYRRLLEAIAADPEARVGEVRLLSPRERRQLLVEWNQSRGEVPRDRGLVELFQSQVEAVGERVALVSEGAQLSYCELNRRANRLGRFLRQLGLGPERRVGIALERSLDQMVAVWGVLKAGAAYVPLDVHLPASRLQYVIEDGGLELILRRGEALSDLRTEVPMVDVGDERIAGQSAADPGILADPANLAYAIYTSGSTGRPKGVSMPQQPLVNLEAALGSTAYASLDGPLRVGLNASFAFDASWQQILQLLNGHTLHLIPESIRRDAQGLVSFLAENRIHSLDCTPTHLQMMLAGGLEEAGWPKVVIAGGEAIDRATWKRLAAHPHTAFINVYGPTECCVNASAVRIAGGDPTIGPPLMNYRLYLLDPLMEPVPMGVAGELYVAGAGLARGYLGRPRETAERFVPDPFGPGAGERLYRTGDFVRYRSDGSPEFQGRHDDQVKLRGNRIELGEIEATLRLRDEVRKAVVIVRDDGASPQIVAYVVAPDPLDEAGLRRHLKERLPEYMIPARFVRLDEIPVSVTGKVDRKALPQPEADRPGLETDFEQAQSEKEETLARIWQEVLGVERVGVRDNFFELGGDSILTIQVVIRANEAGIRLTPRLLFQHQTVAELAAASGEISIQAEQGRVTGEVPLTPIQHWFFELGLRNPDHWNQALMFQGQGRLEADRLRTLLEKLAEHHDALRTRFRREDGRWLQEIDGDPGAAVSFSSQELADLPPDEEKRAIEARAEELQGQLDLEHGPLVAAAYLELGAERGWRFLLVAHHLVVDGVSWRNLLEDLQKGYRQMEAGEEIDFGPKSTSFQFWARRLTEHLGQGALEQEVEIWTDPRRLEVVEIPLDREGDNSESSVRSVEVTLTREETDLLLREVPKAYKTRIDEVLLAAAASALVSWAGREGGVLIDLEGHGREELFEEVDLSRTVGWLTSQYPVYLRPPRLSSTGGELLKAVKEDLRRIPNNGIGYGLLRYLPSSPHRDRLRAFPAPQVSFNYLGQLDRVLGEESLFAVARESAGWVRGPEERRGHVLEIVGSVSGQQLSMQWRYSRNLHDESSVARAAQRFKARLQEIARGSQAAEVEAFTPSDFSKARVSQEQLDKLLGRLSRS